MEADYSQINYDIYNLIKSKEWDKAHKLLSPVQINDFGDLRRETISYLRGKIPFLRLKVDASETSLILTNIFNVSNGDLTPNAKALCMRLIEIYGMDALRQEGEVSNIGTALHSLLAWPKYKICLELLHKMLEVGGPDLVLMVDRKGYSVLHQLCRTHTHSVPNQDGILMEVVEKLLVVGGENLLFLQDEYYNTALHVACDDRDMNLSLIHMLIDYGRKQLVMMTTDIGASILLDPTTLENYHGCEELINRLLEVGGHEYYERCKVVMSDYESDAAVVHASSRFDYFMYE